MPDQDIVLDTPEQIEAYRLIATLHGLRMEIHMQQKYRCPPTACPTRGMALASARRILYQYGDKRPSRTRKTCLARMEALCRELELNTGGKQ